MRISRLLSIVAAATFLIGSPITSAASGEVVDPRYSAAPPLVIAGDPTILRPAKIEIGVGDRSFGASWRDGTPADGSFEYEVLLDGRVLQRTGAGSIYDDSVPYLSSYSNNTLEPGTTYTFGVRRVLPDERRSVTTSVTFTTEGTRLPASQRPPVPVLQGVRTRANSATLDFVPTPELLPEPNWANVSGYDVRMHGREQGYGMTSIGSWFVSGLQPSTTYTIDVRTRDRANNTSDWVPITFSTIAAPPEAPLPAPRPVITAQSGRTVHIEWPPVYDAFGEPARALYRIEGLGDYAVGEPGDPVGGGDFDLEKGAPDEPGRVYHLFFWSLDKDGKESVKVPLDVTLGSTSGAPTTTPVPATTPPVIRTTPVPTTTPVPATTPPVAKTTPAPTTPPVVKTAPPVVKTTPPVVKTTPPIIKTTPPVIKTTTSPVPTTTTTPVPTTTSVPQATASAPPTPAPLATFVPAPAGAALAPAVPDVLPTTAPSPTIAPSAKARAAELSRVLAQSLARMRVATLQRGSAVASGLASGGWTFEVQVRRGAGWATVARGISGAGGAPLQMRSSPADRSRARAARLSHTHDPIRARVVVRLTVGTERVVSTRGFVLRP